MTGADASSNEVHLVETLRIGREVDPAAPPWRLALAAYRIARRADRESWPRWMILDRLLTLYEDEETPPHHTGTDYEN